MKDLYNYYGLTHKGVVKEFNEDFFSGFISQNVHFLMVADGLGGKEGLSFASHIVINEVRRFIEKNVKSDSAEHLKELVETSMFVANRVLLAYKKANDSLYGGLASTLTICAVNKNKDIVVGHIGNSRLYLVRGGNFVQMTKDHTEAQVLVDKNTIAKEEARFHPERATLTKAMGVQEDMACDIFGGKLSKNDIIMLCSDGVFALLHEDEMRDIVREAGGTQKSCEWLVEGANKRGGIDNVTVVLSYVNF